MSSSSLSPHSSPPSEVTPTIVVMAYDRPSSLERLLASLARIERVDAAVDLVVSIDGGGATNRQVVDIATRFTWPHGTKDVIEHEHLGLVEHWHRCGDLTSRTGAVVLLEDDLVVGPGVLQWATAALDASAADDRVAGVCLSIPWFDGYRHLPFEPVLDGSDGLYMQIPWFHGMAWTREMWQRYRTWTVPPGGMKIHAAYDALSDDEWFPDAVRYCVDTTRYYLFPRHAHATNTGVPGAHFDNASSFFEVPLVEGARTAFAIAPLEDALAVYDDHMELDSERLRRLCSDLPDGPLTVDLNAVRDLSTVPDGHVVTIRPVQGALHTWSTDMRPLAMNLVHGRQAYGKTGNGIALAATSDVKRGKVAEWVTDASLRSHAAHGRPQTVRAAVEQRLKQSLWQRMYRR